MRALLWLRSSASTRSLRACSSVFSSSNAFWRACLSEACSQLGPGFCGRNLSDSCGTKPLVSTYLRASSIFLSRKFMPVEVLSKPWRARFELLSKKSSSTRLRSGGGEVLRYRGSPLLVHNGAPARSSNKRWPSPPHKALQLCPQACSTHEAPQVNDRILPDPPCQGRCQSPGFWPVDNVFWHFRQQFSYLQGILDRSKTGHSDD